MNCEICVSTFNLTNHLPMILPCCSYSICKECQNKLIGNPRQKTFQCPIASCGEQNNCEVKFMVNKSYEKLIQQQLLIFCDQHPKSTAEFYCKEDKKLMCASCVITTHQNHDCQKIIKRNVIDYNNLILGKLKIEFERIQNLILEIEAYQQNEIQFKASEYVNLITDIQELILPRLTSSEKEECLNFLNREQVKASEEFKSENTQSIQKLNEIGSNLITQEDELQFLRNSIGNLHLRFELIFRASEDGFGVSDFHRCCDNQGPTLTVIKSGKNRIFGGFTQVSWQSTDYSLYSPDDSAFLFSLTHLAKFDQQSNQDKAVGIHKGWGPTFGSGKDIYIANNCNQNKDSCTHFGGTYSLPNGMFKVSEQAKSYLAGKNKFKVKDYEVYKVIFD